MLGAAALVLWVFQQNRKRETFSTVVPDVVSSRSLLTDNYAMYASKILGFVPGSGGSFYNADKSIVVYPQPSATWLSLYNNAIKQVAMNTVNMYFATPNTLFIFDQPGFQGKMVIIPFDPIPKGQHQELTSNSANALLFVQHLGTITSGKIFSCVVPNNYRIQFIFEGSQAPTNAMKAGGYHAITCPTSIRRIMIEPDISMADTKKN